ncbi:hypothetical protein AB0451_24195 [Streptomyces sp. NPDC052000]|uniref:hypothetical protein n=1 Tax=Streptomyces sp. NPDC052000 TaxID=3155676 RepID=UPI00344CE09D
MDEDSTLPGDCQIASPRHDVDALSEDPYTGEECAVDPAATIGLDSEVIGASARLPSPHRVRRIADPAQWLELGSSP